MSWLTERLATRMRERELTVDALARQLAVERSRLNAIIAGAALPNDNLTRRLARVFGEDPNEWLVQAIKPAADDLAAEMPTGFIKVAAVTEVSEGEMKIVCDGKVVVANVEGRFHAFGNICPHAEGPLGEGFLDGHVVECPWHNGQWDITTGKGLTAFSTADIAVFAVRVVGADIEVKLPAVGAASA
jgi:nitrite reductase/ring-hydroxylating ferredoxin subunit/plasmid maintenance system antidote protein VapI